MLAQQKVCEKHLSPQPKTALRLVIYWPITKKPETIYTTFSCCGYLLHYSLN